MIGARLHHRGFEPEDVSSLIEAYDWLHGLADRDCDCRWNGEQSQIDNPCDQCQARRAMAALARVIEPRAITLHPSRLKNDAERIYYELWVKENERKVGVNGGFTLIEHLLHPEGGRVDPFYKQPVPEVVSQHDMTIATTIIQWLGTSCGRCFIDKAEGEIKKRYAERRAFGTNGLHAPPGSWKERETQGEVYQVADSIAATFVSTEKYPSVFTALRLAIINAIVVFQKQKPPAEKEIQP